MRFEQYSVLFIFWPSAHPWAKCFVSGDSSRCSLAIKLLAIRIHSKTYCETKPWRTKLGGRSPCELKMGVANSFARYEEKQSLTSGIAGKPCEPNLQIESQTNSQRIAICYLKHKVLGGGFCNFCFGPFQYRRSVATCGPCMNFTTFRTSQK